jgi:hypothetical protein
MAVERAAMRSNLERQIPGVWVGRFGGNQGARLTIWGAERSFAGELLSEKFIQQMTAEFAEDGLSLRLVSTGVRTVDGSSAASYSPDTLTVTVAEDGSVLTGPYTDAAGRSGNFEFRKSVR